MSLCSYYKGIVCARKFEAHRISTRTELYKHYRSSVRFNLPFGNPYQNYVCIFQAYVLIENGWVEDSHAVGVPTYFYTEKEGISALGVVAIIISITLIAVCLYVIARRYIIKKHPSPWKMFKRKSKYYSKPLSMDDETPMSSRYNFTKPRKNITSLKSCKLQNTAKTS